MAKLSRQTKETIKTILVLIIVGLLITAYAIYPLNNSDTLFARADLDTFDIDSLPPNSIEPFSDTTWIVDTFTVEPDGLTTIALLAVKNSNVDSAKGTVIVIPASDTTRDSELPLVVTLLENSYNCVIYDQRATGSSSGKHHGFGSLEATDLQQVISFLDIHDKLTQPLYVVGKSLGADAALLCEADESRIHQVIAIDPYLTTDNMIAAAKEKHGSIWFPFYNSVMYWWYKMNSGYAPPYIEEENIVAVNCPTALLTNNKCDALNKLVEVSDAKLLTVDSYNIDELNDKIIGYIEKQ